jgi:YspA, cpYpsA-related SLOG family
MIVLVTGGRDYTKDSVVWDALDQLDIREGPVDLVVQGGCRSGADRFAREWANARERDCLTMNAKWNTQRSSAGPIRNSRMARSPYGIVPNICAAFPGGDGTADMCKKAKLAGIRIESFPPSAPTERETE